MNETLAQWYREHGEEVKAFSRQLWELSETSLEEYESAKLTAAFMEKFGFKTESFNCVDSTKPANTVVATWGSGKPVIGFIGEYDGLPGLGQEVKPYKSPKEGAGQGCGHSLMAPSCRHRPEGRYGSRKLARHHQVLRLPCGRDRGRQDAYVP